MTSMSGEPSQRPRRSHRFAAPHRLTVWLLVMLAATAMTGAPAHAEPGEATDVGACRECHKEWVANIARTPHGRRTDDRTPAAQRRCEHCHGPAEAHAKDPEAAGVIGFGPRAETLASEQSARCLACHEQGARNSWAIGEHAASSVGCSDCHVVHSSPDRVLERKRQAEVCYVCHLENRADARRRSRHPVEEGLVTCSDCHNVHGTAARNLLVEPTVNDTCFLCHPDKRGPYLFEHAPVAEDCSLCHDSHGSNQRDLLTHRAPFLCQQCHNQGSHPSELYDGSGLPTLGRSSSRSLGKLAGRSCMNCHQRVHGSNHPSGHDFSR